MVRYEALPLEQRGDLCLVGGDVTSTANIELVDRSRMSSSWKAGGIPALWNGRTGERIVSHLERLLTQPRG